MTPIMPGQPGYDPNVPVLAVPRMAQVETLLSVMDLGHPYRASTLARMLGMHVARVKPIIGWALQWTDNLEQVPATGRGQHGTFFREGQMIRLSVDMMRVLDLMADGRTRSAVEVSHALGMDMRIVSGLMRSAELRGYLAKTGKRRTRKSQATLYRVKRRIE